MSSLLLKQYYKGNEMGYCESDRVLQIPIDSFIFLCAF